LPETGKWWGNDRIKKEEKDIDIVLADKTGENILTGECK